MNKRTFIKSLALLGVNISSTFGSKASSPISFSGVDFESNDIWEQIRAGYRLKPDYLNLENGYYCFLPEQTLEKYIEHIREINYQGSHYMRTVQFQNKAKSAAKLAELIGADPEEVIVTRNTTESLDLIISGYPWKAGDEALVSNQDYGSMLSMFDLAAKRWKIKINRIDIPLHPQNDEEIVSAYQQAITPNTRLILVPHIVNITGQILPVRKIADMAHTYGAEIMLDGAHAVGHFDFKMSDLDCDYYGSSLHKWLSVPLGAGLLYVKKNRINGIEPLLAPFDMNLKTIAYLNHTGTHPAATDLAILDAIEFHNKIGAKRKEDRLRYIQRYWSDQLRDLPYVSVNTPKEISRSCGIANVGIQFINPTDMGKILLDKYQIYTAAIDGAGVRGCRISPNIYTSENELDQFVSVIKKMSQL